MNDKQLADEIENRRQVNSEEFLGRFLRKHSDQIIAALRRSQPEGDLRELERIAAELDRNRLLSLAADVRDVVRNLSAAEAEGRNG